MAPKTSLRELTAFLRKANFYLGGDTGPMHIAAAVDTPCVSLHGPTLPAKSGAYGPRNIAVQAFYQPAGRRTGNEAMQAIDIERVCGACDEMLSRLNQPALEIQAA